MHVAKQHAHVNTDRRRLVGQRDLGDGGR